MQFKRSIGPFALWLTAVGGIVGSGWLFGPLYAAQIAGPAAIISWILGGVLMMIIAFTFAELGSSFPVAGSMVRFAEYSHGPLFSFTIGWMIWLASVVVAPIETLAIIQYAASYIPGLMRSNAAGVHIITGVGILFAAALMFIMCFLNYYGIKFFSRSSSIIVAIKLIVPAIALIVLFTLDFHGRNFHSTAGFIPYGWHGILTALPLGGVIYSFIGYSPVLQLAEEAKRPHIMIPVAIILALLFCIVLYTLLQVAFIGALTPADLASGWQKLTFSGDNGPFAGIFAAFGLTWLVMIIYADAVISPFGTGFIYTTATARIGYGLSKIGFFPELLQKLTKNGVPMRCIVLNFIVGMFLFLPFPGWQSMASFLVSCFIISYIIGPIALVGLRKAQPNLTRPFRLPAASLFALLSFYICNLMIFWTGWQVVYKLLIALIVGFVVFLIYSARNTDKKPAAFYWQSAWWLLPYLIGVGIISYLGTFGHGTGVIKFGWDFLVIALFTIVVFYCAIAAVNKDALKTLNMAAVKVV